MKFILALLLLITVIVEVDGQTIKYKSFKLCVQQLSTEKESCKETECLIVFNFTDKRIKIYGAIIQTLDIVEVLETLKSDDPKHGGKQQHFRVVDQDGKDADVFFYLYSLPGYHKAQLTLGYQDYVYYYYLKSAD